jgi:cbb3-type cytochrome oxidase subunit 3
MIGEVPWVLILLIAVMAYAYATKDRPNDR